MFDSLLILHPETRNSDEDLALRMAFVSTAMASGGCLEQLDRWRPILARVGVNLTASSHLRLLVPAVAQAEQALILQEIKGCPAFVLCF